MSLRQSPQATAARWSKEALLLLESASLSALRAVGQAVRDHPAALLFAAAGVSATLFLRARSALAQQGSAAPASRLLKEGRSQLLSRILDIGGFFGADIGGSLTKLVFFEPAADVTTGLIAATSSERVSSAGWQKKLQGVQHVRRSSGGVVCVFVVFVSVCLCRVLVVRV